MPVLSAPDRAPLIFIQIILAASLALRLISLFAAGLCDDEAYVVAISRAPALSYFDHPPLHQWVLYAWTSAFGEGRAARLPFLGFLILTGVALFGLSRRLFSTEAAWWSVFAFGASAYFLVCPDGYILPDPPVLAFSALGAWAVAEILFGPPGRETPLWAAAGVALGLAGLSKYSAIFVPLGLAGFFLTSPRARRWLADPRPYLAALLALPCLAPPLIWNAEHGWVSFSFQSARAARRLTLTGKAVGEIFEALGAQIGSMTPWLMIPLVAGLARATRRGADSPERFLLWLAAPPLLLFLLMPLLGERPIAHWFNTGWLFAFPLAGDWLARRSPRFQFRFVTVTAFLSAILYVGYLTAVLGGPLLPKSVRDPTRDMFDWPAASLRDAFARSHADFVLIEHWRVGGRVGVALGPEVPICAMGGDPRGFAFACDASRRRGRTALIIRAKDNAKDADEARYFAVVEPFGELTFGRNGAAERTLVLEVGHDLMQAPPLPYGP